MFPREIQSELENLVADYPVVTLIGPRQSGKTTLVRHLFPEKAYVSLEAPDIRAIAQEDPRAFISKYRYGILDEIQRAPQLLSYIQNDVDEEQQKGMFILTGSHQIELHQAISQSLAGRTALLTLLPMSIRELEMSGFTFDLDEYLFLGGYPRIFKDQLDATKAYRNYFQTYIERDLRQILNVKDLLQFQKFVKLCAGRIGQLLNSEGLANEVGVSAHTIKNWISILEASFIVMRLQPYFENFGKRLVKSPKLYFTDVGLACYLLGIEDLNQLSRDPLRGNLVENLVLLELLKARLNAGKESQLYFYRDSKGNEVDFIFKSGSNLIPVEVKASQTFHKDFLKGVDYFKDLVGDRCSRVYLVYAGEEQYNIKNVHLINFKNSSQIVNY